MADFLRPERMAGEDLLAYGRRVSAAKRSFEAAQRRVSAGVRSGAIIEDAQPRSEPSIEKPEESPEDVYFRQTVAASGDEAEDGRPGTISLDPVAWMFEAIFWAIGGLLNPRIQLADGTIRTFLIWNLKPGEDKKCARAWLAWIKSLPKKQSAVLMMLTRDIAPTITLLSTFGGIIGTRIDALAKFRAQMEKAGSRVPSTPRTPSAPSPNGNIGMDARVAQTSGGDPFEGMALEDEEAA